MVVDSRFCGNDRMGIYYCNMQSFYYLQGFAKFTKIIYSLNLLSYNEY